MGTLDTSHRSQPDSDTKVDAGQTQDWEESEKREKRKKEESKKIREHKLERRRRSSGEDDKTVWSIILFIKSYQIH
jgi:hypothetical protein